MIKNQIDVLNASFMEDVVIKHELILTLVDGKVCQHLTNTRSSSCCYICSPETPPSKMNNLKVIQEKQINHDYLQYSISPLHLFINTL